MENEQLSLTLKVQIDLDQIDLTILKAFLRYPNKRWRVQQLKTILEYEGIDITSAAVRDRLRFLVAISIIGSHKGSRVSIYELTCSMSSDQLHLLYSAENMEKMETGLDEVFPSSKRGNSVFRK